MLDAATACSSAHLGLSDAVRAAREEEPVTYVCVLPVPHRAVAFVAAVLQEHWRQLGTRSARRALSAWDQAVAFWRWMGDGVEPDRLAGDAGIGRSTAHRHVDLDGTLVRTDRVCTLGPTSARTSTRRGPRRREVDLGVPPACGGGWSGERRCHGGNVQVVTAPHGWPLWLFGVRPGREHDVTAAGHDPQVLASLDAWCHEQHAALADLG